MVKRAKTALAQVWSREVDGRLGKLNNRNRRRGNTTVMGVVPNTLIVTPDLILHEGTQKLKRRCKGKGIGEFVPPTRVKKDLRKEEELKDDDSDDDAATDEEPEDENAVSLLFALASGDESDGEGSGSEDEDITNQVQCEFCKRWEVFTMNTGQRLRKNTDDVKFYCSPQCKAGLSIPDARPMTASSHHNEFVRDHLHDKTTGRVQEVKIAEKKTEQKTRNLEHRVKRLREELGTTAHVSDLSSEDAPMVAFGQGTRTIDALPELRRELCDTPAAKKWKESSLPPRVNLAIVGFGGVIITTDATGNAEAMLAQPDETVTDCLAVELTKSDWIGLGECSNKKLAAVMVKPTTKTSGIAAFDTCIGKGKGLQGHRDCPACGLGPEQMPEGISVPTALPTEQKTWKLSPQLLTTVSDVITMVSFSVLL